MKKQSRIDVIVINWLLHSMFKNNTLLSDNRYPIKIVGYIMLTMKLKKISFLLKC